MGGEFFIIAVKLHTCVQIIRENPPRFVLLIEKKGTQRCLNKHFSAEPLKSRKLPMLMLHSQGALCTHLRMLFRLPQSAWR